MLHPDHPSVSLPRLMAVPSQHPVFATLCSHSQRQASLLLLDTPRLLQVPCRGRSVVLVPFLYLFVQKDWFYNGPPCMFRYVHCHRYSSRIDTNLQSIAKRLLSPSTSIRINSTSLQISLQRGKFWLSLIGANICNLAQDRFARVQSLRLNTCRVLGT